MSNMKKVSVKYLGYLFRFMYLFKIDRFKILEVTNKKINVQIGWPDDGSLYYEEDEEVQEIEWDVQEFSNIEDALLLAEFIYDNNLIDIDKIIISPEELLKKIQWNEKRFELALGTLLNIKVDMIDDGKKSDYFFIHF